MDKIFKVTCNYTTYTHYWVKADNKEQAEENLSQFERCEDDPLYGDNDEEIMDTVEVSEVPTKTKHQQYQNWLKDCPVNYNQDSTDDDGDDEIHVVGFVVPKNKEANNDQS